VDFEARFRQARADGDSAAATRCAHDLKSLAGSLCIPALQQSASALESACSEGADDAAIGPLLQDVMARLEPVVGALQARMPAHAE
jgi:HPt (histidine-containing phosphotransfer) domain-containing protein